MTCECGNPAERSVDLQGGGSRELCTPCWGAQMLAWISGECGWVVAAVGPEENVEMVMIGEEPRVISHIEKMRAAGVTSEINVFQT